MKIEIIPAIDIIGGECVRLVQGDYSRKTVYSSDPLDVAKKYEEIGIKRIHLVDLDGAKTSSPQNLEVLRSIANSTSLKVQYGGGIKSDVALRKVFDNGADRAICGSIAVIHPEIFERWLTDFGEDRMILGADTVNGRVAVNGWKETSSESVEMVIGRFVLAGLRHVICTDISKDGMLQGPAFGLYERLYDMYPSVDITVSGGIRDMKDIKRLDSMEFNSVIVGKALYEGMITLDELRGWLQKE